MKKKFLAAFLVFGMVATIGLSGCSKGDEKKTTDESSKEESTSTLSADALREELLADIDTEVVLGDYKSITVESEQIVVTDEEVQEAIDYDLETYGEQTQITEGTVEDGDVINIDYSGTMNGEALENGSEEDAQLEIGSGSFIEGFESALIGATIGETTTINVTFPEDYQATELAGQPAEFTVTVNYKYGDVIPAELTDELVVEMALGDDITTVDAYKAYVRETLEANAVTEQESVDYNAVLDQLISICTINTYDEDLDKDTIFEEDVAYMEQEAEYYSYTLDEYLALYGVTYEEYETITRESIDVYVDESMIYRAIANAENIAITQEELEAEVATYSADYESYGCASVEEFEETYGIQIYELMLYDEIKAMLMENATVNYVEAGTAETTETAETAE